jgi:hypothetical protein
MKRKVIIGSVAFLLLAASLAMPAAKPNFSGTWEMDTNRSIGIPPGMKQTLTITHNGDRIELEAKIVTAQGERLIKDGYTLDGKEADFTPQGPSGATGKGKRTASWMPNDRGVVISDVTTMDSPKGPVTTQLVRKWQLSTDGATLIVDRYVDGPNGSGESRQIFIKK